VEKPTIQYIVEKPTIHLAPSNYAIIGRYILTPEIFSIIEATAAGSGTEIQLTDAIQTLSQFDQVLDRTINGEIYDIGDKFGFVKTTIDYVLKREVLRSELEQYLRIQTSHELVGEYDENSCYWYRICRACYRSMSF